MQNSPVLLKEGLADDAPYGRCVPVVPMTNPRRRLPEPPAVASSAELPADPVSRLL